MIKLNIKQNHSRKLAILLTVLLIFLLSACSPEASNYQSRLVVSTPSDASTFNSPLNQSAYSVFGYIYEGLIIENGITGELEPALAESWEVSEDEQTIVITLKED